MNSKNLVLLKRDRKEKKQLTNMLGTRVMLNWKVCLSNRKACARKSEAEWRNLRMLKKGICGDAKNVVKKQSKRLNLNFMLKHTWKDSSTPVFTVVRITGPGLP